MVYFCRHHDSEHASGHAPRLLASSSQWTALGLSINVCILREIRVTIGTRASWMTIIIAFNRLQSHI